MQHRHHRVENCSLKKKIRKYSILKMVKHAYEKKKRERLVVLPFD